LLVNLTSDQWFAGSTGPEFHLALATYRAVEHRRYLIRATTTGVSAVIAPTGKVVWRLPENTQAAAVADVAWVRGRTFYETIGNWPFWLAPLFLVLGARPWRTRRSGARICRFADSTSC
jgi:apolipoprotein N-acyltransferase